MDQSIRSRNRERGNGGNLHSSSTDRTGQTGLGIPNVTGIHTACVTMISDTPTHNYVHSYVHKRKKERKNLGTRLVEKTNACIANMHSIRTFGFFDCVLFCFLFCLFLFVMWSTNSAAICLSLAATKEGRKSRGHQLVPDGPLYCVSTGTMASRTHTPSLSCKLSKSGGRVRELDIPFPFPFELLLFWFVWSFCLGLGRRRQGKMPRRWKTSIVGDDHIDSHWLADESDDILAATRAFPYRWQAVQAGQSRPNKPNSSLSYNSLDFSSCGMGWEFSNYTV